MVTQAILQQNKGKRKYIQLGERVKGITCGKRTTVTGILQKIRGTIGNPRSKTYVIKAEGVLYHCVSIRREK